MLLLEFHNKIVEDTILEKFEADPSKREAVEAVVADFDGVLFHIFTSGEAKNILTVSLSIKCFGELRKHGVEDVLKQHYGDKLVAPESGYDATVSFSLDNPPADKAAFAREVALLKRHALAAPFYKVFADIEAKKSGDVIELPYRDEEAVYIKPEGDRCIVIFSVSFRDAGDAVLAKAFLQEYQDARRTMTNVPSVTYAQKEPPLELKGVRNLKVGENVSFVSFVLFAPHISGKKKETSVDNIQTFRNYLQYHLKCSKAYLHTRMRNRVRSFLQVLNRAKSEPQGAQKKTITGKTFTRADDPQPAETGEEQFNI